MSRAGGWANRKSGMGSRTRKPFRLPDGASTAVHHSPPTMYLILAQLSIVDVPPPCPSRELVLHGSDASPGHPQLNAVRSARLPMAGYCLPHMRASKAGARGGEHLAMTTRTLSATSTGDVVAVEVLRDPRVASWWSLVCPYSLAGRELGSLGT